MRDSTRQRTYDAEISAFYDTKAEEVIGWSVIHEVLEVLASWDGWEWPMPRLERRRADANHSTYVSGAAVISLSPFGCTIATLLHELSHHLTVLTYGHDVAGHGPEFRGVEMWLVGLALGSEPQMNLARAFLRSRLSVTEFRPSQNFGLVVQWELDKHREELARLGEEIPQNITRLNGAIPL